MAREIVRTIMSMSGFHRAEIVRLPSSGFRIEVSRWTEEWVEGYGKVAEFWEQLHDGATFTDTVERAETLAAEKLFICE